GAADAAVCPGDQGCLAGQALVTSIRALAVVRLGPHLGLSTGVRLALFREGWPGRLPARILGVLICHLRISFAENVAPRIQVSCQRRWPWSHRGCASGTALDLQIRDERRERDNLD